MSIKKVFESSLDVIDGVNFKLFTVALLYIDDIDDDDIEYLEPVEVIDKKEIRDFFQTKLDERIKK